MKKMKMYEGICPACGETMWICKSIAMKTGINAGVGECPYCKSFLHMTFDEERQEMNLEKFEDYQKRHCKGDEKNVNTNGASDTI